jgi:hypothetical protein
MSAVFGGNEAEFIAGGLEHATVKELQLQEQQAHPVGLVMIGHLACIEKELRRIRSFTPEYGRQFLRSDGGQAPASGNILFVAEGPKSGNDWYVERVAISVNANVAAVGAAALYAGQLADESQIIDNQPVPIGNPSRLTFDGHGGAAYFVYGGGPVAILVAGLAAGNPVTMRLQAREVLSHADPALRNQQSY